MLIPFPRRSVRPLSYLMIKFRCALYTRAPRDEMAAWEAIMDEIEDGIEDAAEDLLDQGERALLRHVSRAHADDSATVGVVFGGSVLSRYVRDFSADVETRVREASPQHLSTVPRVMEQLRRWLIRMGYGAVVEGPAQRAIRARAAEEALPRARALAAILRATQVSDHPGSNGHFHYSGELAIAKVARGRVWLEQGVAEDLLGPIDIPSSAISVDEVDWVVDGVLCRAPDGWRLMDIHAVFPVGLLADGTFRH